jgi:carboxyl-terminal processing protease
MSQWSFWMSSSNVLVGLTCLLIFLADCRLAKSAGKQDDVQDASFELVWGALRDHYWDPNMGGCDWQSIHDTYRSPFDQAKTRSEGEAVLDRMIHELPSSHLAIIPAQLYRQPSSSVQAKQAGKTEVEDDNSGSLGIEIVVVDNAFAVERVDSDGAAAKAGVHSGWTIQSVDRTPAAKFLEYAPPGSSEDRRQFAQEILDGWLHGPQGSTISIAFRDTDGRAATLHLVRQAPSGELVQFGNLPPEHVIVEHRLLASGVGYVRLNLFLDPVLVMPEIERAVKDFRNAPGMVLDLRGNPGGLGIMAMGIAGWFVSKPDQLLGTMTRRDASVPFEINPRLQAYTGRLAILVDHGSASTSEILAQGLQDLGRARIFGSRTAGAALPSEIIQLPNGDRFQYPEANYISTKGRVLEGNGVEPNVAVAPTLAALAQDTDLPLESAAAWVRVGNESNKLGNAR